MELLMTYNWDGNIRELENLIERLIKDKPFPIRLVADEVDLEDRKDHVERLLKAVEEAKVSAPVHAPDEAKVTKPGFVHASVFPEKERPVPPKA